MASRTGTPSNPIIVKETATAENSSRQGDKNDPIDVDKYEGMDGWNDNEMRRYLLIQQKLKNITKKENSLKEKNGTH